MKVAKTVAAARTLLRRSAQPRVLIPTMGALHHGHAALITAARKKAGKNGTVVVSIFVNPAQFGPKEDFSAYPRPLKNDLALCRSHGADVVFAPSVEEMYAEDRSAFVDEPALAPFLCGASRPGHFRGVCTVVAKLFNILQPDLAIFGEKDWQQLAILRRMTRDLDFPIRLIGHPTVRESDGLATSSRNIYLSSAERGVAPAIYTALQRAAEKTGVGAIVRAAETQIRRIPGAKIDYVQLVDAETLAPVKNLQRPMRLAAAVFLGKARLIDNVPVLPRT